MQAAGAIGSLIGTTGRSSHGCAPLHQETDRTAGSPASRAGARSSGRSALPYSAHARVRPSFSSGRAATAEDAAFIGRWVGAAGRPARDH
jgi:hypothetical protein